MTDSISVSTVLPATPKQIYDAWLSSKGHTEMTGSEAKGNAKVGSVFTAWDGYIEGKNLELEPGKRIVQSWRTSEFPDEAEDSRLEVILRENNTNRAGTITTLNR